MDQETAAFKSNPANGGQIVIKGKPYSKSPKQTTSTTVIAPDGGYGWVILLASFAINVIVDGIIFSFGMLLGPIGETFRSKDSSVAWVGSMQAGFYLLAGPVVSGLCNKYGARTISVIGSFVVAISMAFSAFSTSLWMMMILYGFLGGIGYGMLYLPAIVIVGEYFDKRRAFATGIAVSGSGIGGFMFAQLIQVLLEHYLWRGTVLILAGISLNCAVFAALFRPLKAIRRPEADPELNRSEDFVQRIQDARDARIRLLNSEMDSTLDQEDATPKQPLISNQVLTKIVENDLEPAPSPYKAQTTVEISYRSVGNINEAEKMRLDDAQLFRRNSREPLDRGQLASSKRSINSASSAPFSKPDVLYSGSVQNLPEVKKFGNVQDFRASVNAVNAEKYPKRSRLFPDSASRIIRQMLDVSLLKNYTFLLTCFSSFLTLAGFFIPFVFIKKFVLGTGVSDSEGTWILSAISVTNTIGRIVVGFVSDLPAVDPIVVACSALIVGGVATCFLPFISGMVWLVIYALIFGLAISAFAALRSIILVDLFGIGMLNNSFGLQMLFQGLATLVGSPIGGAIAGATGSLNGTFYFGGALITASGALLFPAKLLQRWEQRKYPGSFTKTI